MKLSLKPLTISTLAVGMLSTLAISSAQAVRLANGTTMFEQPPNLVEATTLDQSSVGNGRFHFVIAFPPNAGEPLEAVVITPRNFTNQIAFNLESSEAELATAYARGPMVPLSSVGGDTDNPNDVVVVFADPVQPGQIVTVRLTTKHNPPGGVYLFDVTGYPAGPQGVGQFLGVGRIQIYDPSN
jgi:hypothetical protein